MSFRLILSPEAEEQLASLYQYIADAASLETADDYTEAITALPQRRGRGEKR